MATPDVRPAMRSGFAQHITPLMSPSKGVPLTASPIKLFTRMNTQMRQDQIHAAAHTLRNTIIIERAIAVAGSHTARMKQSEMEATGAEFKVVALDARIETAFKDFRDIKGFSEEALTNFISNLNGLLADLAGVVPGLDLTKISQGIEEFRTIYEAHDIVYTPMSVAL